MMRWFRRGESDEDERGQIEQRLLRQVEQLRVDEARDEFSRYVGKHSLPPKRRWWHRWTQR